MSLPVCDLGNFLLGGLDLPNISSLWPLLASVLLSPLPQLSPSISPCHLTLLDFTHHAVVGAQCLLNLVELDYLNCNFSIFFFFWLCHPACMSSSQPGIEPVPPLVDTWHPNHWTSGEFPTFPSLKWENWTRILRVPLALTSHNFLYISMSENDLWMYL